MRWPGFRKVRHTVGSGVAARRPSARTLRQLRMQRITMVFQHFALVPWRTVRHNVALGLELRGMPRHEREGRVREALSLVGLNDDLLALQRALPRTILFVTHDVTEALKMGSNVAILESGTIVQVGTPEDIALRPATGYVREFVAGLNPLGVLRAATIMRPVVAEDRRIELDAEGRPAPSEFARTVTGETALREVIAVCAANGAPVLVTGEDGQLAGIIEEAEILRALVPRI